MIMLVKDDYVSLHSSFVLTDCPNSMNLCTGKIALAMQAELVGDSYKLQIIRQN